MQSRKVILMISSIPPASILAASRHGLGKETFAIPSQRGTSKSKIFPYSFVWLIVVFLMSQLNCLEGRPSSLFQEASVDGYQQFSRQPSPSQPHPSPEQEPGPMRGPAQAQAQVQAQAQAQIQATNFASQFSSPVHPHPLPFIRPSLADGMIRKNVTRERIQDVLLDDDSKRVSNMGIGVTVPGFDSHFHPARILQINPGYTERRSIKPVHLAGHQRAQPRKLDFDPETQEANDMQAFQFHHPAASKQPETEHLLETEYPQQGNRYGQLVTTTSAFTHHHLYSTTGESATSTTTTTPSTVTTKVVKGKQNIALDDPDNFQQGASELSTEQRFNWVTKLSKALSKNIRAPGSSAFLSTTTLPNQSDSGTSRTEDNYMRHEINTSHAYSYLQDLENKIGKSSRPVSSGLPLQSPDNMEMETNRKAIIRTELEDKDNESGRGERLSADHLNVSKGDVDVDVDVDDEDDDDDDDDNVEVDVNINVNPIHFSHSTSNDDTLHIHNIASITTSSHKTNEAPDPNQNQNQSETDSIESHRPLWLWPTSALSTIPVSDAKDKSSSLPSSVVSTESQGYAKAVNGDTKEGKVKEVEQLEQPQFQTLPVFPETMAHGVENDSFTGEAQLSPAPSTASSANTTTHTGNSNAVPSWTISSEPHTNIHLNLQSTRLVPIPISSPSNSHSNPNLAVNGNGNLLETRTTTSTEHSFHYTNLTNANAIAIANANANASTNLTHLEDENEQLPSLPSLLLSLFSSFLSEYSSAPQKKTTMMDSRLLQEHNEDDTYENEDKIIGIQIGEQGEEQEKGHGDDAHEQEQVDEEKETEKGENSLEKTVLEQQDDVVEDQDQDREKQKISPTSLSTIFAFTQLGDDEKTQAKPGQDTVEYVDENHHQKDIDDQSPSSSLVEVENGSLQEEDYSAVDIRGILGPGPTIGVIAAGIGIALYVYGRTWSYVIPNYNTLVSNIPIPTQNLGMLTNILSSLGGGGGAPGGGGGFLGGTHTVLARTYEENSNINRMWYPQYPDHDLLRRYDHFSYPDPSSQFDGSWSYYNSSYSAKTQENPFEQMLENPRKYLQHELYFYPGLRR